MSRRATVAGVAGQGAGDEVGHELPHGVRYVLLGVHDRGQHAEEAGVVGDRVEVERRVEPDLEAGGVGQRSALRVAVGVVGGGAGAVEERVVGEVGVGVEVAEVGVAQGVRLGRGGFLGRSRALRRLHRRAAVAGAARCGQAEQGGGSDCGDRAPTGRGASGAMLMSWHDTSLAWQRGLSARCRLDQSYSSPRPFRGVALSTVRGQRALLHSTGEHAACIPRASMPPDASVLAEPSCAAFTRSSIPSAVTPAERPWSAAGVLAGSRFDARPSRSP